MPASAVSAGAGVVVASKRTFGHNVDATLSYEAVPFNDGVLVEFNCKVLAWPAAASTGIGTCSVFGVEALGSPNNLPGSASVAAGVVYVPRDVSPMACLEGHATFIDGTWLSTGTDCAPLGLLSVNP